MAVCQNLVPLVNIKIAGKWMFIPLKMVFIGIDPYPNRESPCWFLTSPACDADPRWFGRARADDRLHPGRCPTSWPVDKTLPGRARQNGWVLLRKSSPETIDFPIFSMEFSCNFFPEKPIHWVSQQEENDWNGRATWDFCYEEISFGM